MHPRVDARDVVRAASLEQHGPAGIRERVINGRTFFCSNGSPPVISTREQL